MPAALTAAQIRFLRGQAHELRPILQVGGKGITDSLLAELDGALEHHELVKVKIASDDRGERESIIARLTASSGASLVQKIGKVAVLYRQTVEGKRHIVLPRP